MKSVSAILIHLLFFLNVNAQLHNTYYVGHSLVNLNIPFMVKNLSTQRGIETDYRHHINIGTSLKGNWNDTNFNSNPIWNPDLGYDVEYGTNHLEALMQPFEKMLVTESVPLTDNPIDTSVKYATLFFNYAKNYNPNIKKYLYATWEHFDMGNVAWRNALSSLQPRWETIADRVKNNLGNDTVYIVPANLAMAALYDTLQLHTIGSISSINQLFSDDIHCTNDGNYFIACIMLAAVYHIDPRGLDVIQAGPYTIDMAINDNVLRQKLQEIAWQTACNYSRSSLHCTATGIDNSIDKNQCLSVFPNPSSDFLLIQNKNTYKAMYIQIFDIYGKCVYSNQVKNTINIDISQWNKGVYLIKSEGKSLRILIH
jgi:hypothetical protein